MVFVLFSFVVFFVFRSLSIGRSSRSGSSSRSGRRIRGVESLWHCMESSLSRLMPVGVTLSEGGMHGHLERRERKGRGSGCSS